MNNYWDKIQEKTKNYLLEKERLGEEDANELAGYCIKILRESGTDRKRVCIECDVGAELSMNGKSEKFTLGEIMCGVWSSQLWAIHEDIKK